MDITVIFVGSIFIILVFLYLLGARRKTTRDNVFPKIFPLAENEEEEENEK